MADLDQPGPGDTDAPGTNPPPAPPAEPPKAPDAPVVPEKYEFTRPEGVGEDIEMDIEGLSAAMKAAGYTQEQAQDSYAVLAYNRADAVKRLLAQQDAATKAEEKKWQEAIAADPNAAETTLHVNRALAIGTPEEQAAMKAANPLVRSFLAKIGKGIGEALPLPGGPGRPQGPDEPGHRVYPDMVPKQGR